MNIGSGIVPGAGRWPPIVTTPPAKSSSSSSLKKSISDLKDEELKGKRVLVRCDLNVPLDKKTFAVTDDTRIRGSIPTVKYLVSKGAKVGLPCIP